MFVLDEADEMLSRGFKDQIYDVFQKIPSSVQVRKRCILALCHHINSNKCGPQNKHHLYQQKYMCSQLPLRRTPLGLARSVCLREMSIL